MKPASAVGNAIEYTTSGFSIYRRISIPIPANSKPSDSTKPSLRSSQPHHHSDNRPIEPRTHTHDNNQNHVPAGRRTERSPHKRSLHQTKPTYGNRNSDGDRNSNGRLSEFVQSSASATTNGRRSQIQRTAIANPTYGHRSSYHDRNSYGRPSDFVRSSTIVTTNGRPSHYRYTFANERALRVGMHRACYTP
jgi:hypothetical protein